MSDDKWLLTEVEVGGLLPFGPIPEGASGYGRAIWIGARAQIAKLRRLGWQEPDMPFGGEPIGGRPTYLWTKHGIKELKPCEVRLIEFPRLYKEEK